MKTGVVGASGYAGGELLRLLSMHPNFELFYIAAGSNAGEPITNVHPQLTQFSGRNFAVTEISKINECDVVFLALPHGESAKLIAQISDTVKVVDLGADFRLASKASWEKYYGGTYAGSWQYGLPELLNIDAKSNRISNPGCYATAIALAAAPAVQNSLIAQEDIVVVAASGTTGAGRSAKINLIASEVMNSLTSYKFGGIHQHTPEIEETLSKLSENPSVKISFTPILAPMPRGILATVTAKLNKNISQLEISKIYSDFYATAKFVHLLPNGQMPQTNSVLGSNSAHIQVAIDVHTNRLVISIAIDNLGKGAAGQAIQNANIISGLPEETGLVSIGIGS